MSDANQAGEAPRTAFVTHSDCSRHDTGWRHPEHQGRLPAVARAVHRDMLTLFDHLREMEGVPATRAELRLAHTAEYITRVEQRCAEAAAAGSVLRLDGEVMVSGASWDAVRAAVGCVLTAVESVQQGIARNAFCAVRPPGHGAASDSAGAFGIFNSVAVAALQRAREGGDVLLLELGSRAGAGTARIVEGHRGVRFVSIHREGEHALPLSSAVVRVLPGGGSGADALAALSSALDEATANFVPDLLLLSLGFDALAGDPLGGLSLVPADYYTLTAAVRERAEMICGGRLVSVMEEGYDAEAMARAVVQHLRALAALGRAD